MDKERKRAVGYIRVSTDEQAKDGYSLENQELEIKRKCEYEKWELHNEIFRDEGVSGATIEKRDGIQQLLKYVKLNKVDYVVVYKVSRLSRKMEDIVNIVRLLESAGVSVISIKDNINTSESMGKSILYIGGIFAEMERENIIVQVKGGMEQKAREGEWCGGKPPLGYDLVDKELQINKEEAEIIKTIFVEYMKGKGYKAIADLLNVKGFKTKRKSEFNGVGIKEILRNPIYAGQIRWGYREDWGKLHEGNKRKRKYSENPIIVEGKHEGIIDKNVFNKVQEKIDNNPRHHMKQFNGNHLLSGLLRCPDCGYGMSIQHVKSKGKEYYYYTCNQYQTYKRCKPNAIRKEDIEKEFLNIFESVINEPDTLKVILDSLNQTDKQIKEIEKNIKRKEKEIRDLRTSEDKLLEELLNGNDNFKNTIRRKIEDVADRITSLEQDITKFENNKQKTKSAKLDINEITELFKSVGKVIPLLKSSVQQSIVRKLIKTIKIKNKHISEIYFSFEESVKLEYDGTSNEVLFSNQSFRINDGTVNRTISKCGLLR